MGLKNSPKPLVFLLVVFLCRCSYHYTIHLSIIPAIQNSTIQKLPAKTAPSYFPLHHLQSVVPITTLYLYIILVNTKHQSSKKPSWSSKPHKASILGLFVILFMYFMYFNFSNISPFPPFYQYPLFIASFLLYHFQTFTILQIRCSNYYTIHFSTIQMFSLPTIYNTTIPLYNSLLFQLLSPYYTNYQ